jgi:hypothetical protein
MNKGNNTDKNKDTMVACGQVAGKNFDEQIHSSFDPSMMVPIDGQWNCGEKVPLPLGYSPSPQCVVIGRGRLTMGRSRLRMIAAQFLEQYSDANTKQVAKSAIVSKIIKMTEEGCPYGAFVKFTDGRWWQVDSSKAREKVGYVLRDLLQDKYRSSSQSKAATSRLRAKEKRSTRTSSCSSVGSCSSFSSVSISDGAPLSMKTDEGLNHVAKPNFPTSNDATAVATTFDCASATCDGNNRNSTSSYTRVFGQKDDPFEPISFHPAPNDVVPWQPYNVSKATTINPTQFYDLDFVEMKGNPVQVPVGEELSSVFD